MRITRDFASEFTHITARNAVRYKDGHRNPFVPRCTANHKPSLKKGIEQTLRRIKVAKRRGMSTQLILLRKPRKMKTVRMIRMHHLQIQTQEILLKSV